ncbi:MAG: hypothetical protein R3F59_09675 [Myxococcota bacterium]
MVPQRLLPFRRGRALRFDRWCHQLPYRSSAHRLLWTERGLACLVRAGWDRALLSVDGASGIEARSPAGQRLMGLAATPAGDAVAIVHEHPDGARLATFGRAPAARVYPERHYDVTLATDGERIVLRGHLAPPTVLPWSLAARTPWGGPCDGLASVQAVDGAVLVLSRTAASLRAWDGAAIATWPLPRPDAWLAAWHRATPVVFAGGELLLWDLASGRTRSLGAARSYPDGSVAPDGRWLVIDRVGPQGRGLELWDLREPALVERLPTRGRACTCAFSPDGAVLGVAIGDDLFLLRVDVPGVTVR